MDLKAICGLLPTNWTIAKHSMYGISLGAMVLTRGSFSRKVFEIIFVCGF
jgi:hypothetical protein